MGLTFRAKEFIPITFPITQLQDLLGLQAKTSEGPPGVRPWGLLSSLAAAGFLIASGAPAFSHTLYVEDPLCQSRSDTKDVSAPIRRYCLSIQYRHSLHHVRTQLTEDTYEQWTQVVRKEFVLLVIRRTGQRLLFWRRC